MKGLKKKFLPAFAGLADGFRDSGIRVQYILALCAVMAGFVLKLSAGEWIAVIVCIGMVVASEMLNTCIEKLCDLYTMEEDARIKMIKDLAAGAVLVAGAASLACAIIILIRHIS